MAPRSSCARPGAGDQATDHRAGIYAFGLVAYETLTGMPPLAAGSDPELMALRLAHPPLPL